MTKTPENKKNLEKDNFKALINKLNSMSDKIEEAETAIGNSTNKTAAKKKLVEGAKEDGIMKDIVNRFNAVIEKNIAPVLMEEINSTEFALAVKTKATDTGVKVGNWEIVKIEEDKSISYDIVENNSKEVVLENLKTYAAANAIVKLLNMGEEITNAEIKKFVNLDEDFSVNYQDAIRYGKKFKKTGNVIYEDRYNICKGRAEQLKETIKASLEMIGR